MIAEKGKLARIEYKLYLDGFDGDEVYSTECEENKYVEVVLGEGELLESFEDKLEGLEEGVEFRFEIKKEEAYGDIDDELFIGYPKNEFMEELEVNEIPQEGDVVPMEDDNGEIFDAVVNEITEDHIILDFNHPFAGEDLYIVGKILKVGK